MTGVCEPLLWTGRAACRGLPTSWWYPQQGDPTAPALEICATCPVLAECREWVTKDPDPLGHQGIAGGLTAKRRRQLRKQRNNNQPNERKQQR